jgi:hypothetical protein
LEEAEAMPADTPSARGHLALVRAESVRLTDAGEPGRWFHATFAENRESIRRHGLDFRRMAGPGIAGSLAAEAAGVFLTGDLESARWLPAWVVEARSISGRPISSTCG